MSANQFNSLKSGDSFLGQGRLPAQVPRCHRIHLELLGVPRTWLSLAQGNMRQNLLVATEPSSFLLRRLVGSYLQGPPSASSWRAHTHTHHPQPQPQPQSGALLRAPNPDSGSSSSCFPACLPPILWPSQSQLPKITQRLGVLCPERCCCLVWGRERAQETLGGGDWGCWPPG